MVAPHAAELRSSGFTARELTLCNALRKGSAVLRSQANVVVLAADTVVALDDQVLGKPGDMREARKFLRLLSGRTHRVYSSVFVADQKRQRLICESSEVTFRPLSERDIASHLRKIDPLDKAGAYAAQGHGAEMIERIGGSYTNVVGLPMEQTIALLREFGIVSASQPVRVPQFAPARGDRVSARDRGTRR